MALKRARRSAAPAVRISSMDLLDKVAPSRPGWRRHVVAVLAHNVDAGSTLEDQAWRATILAVVAGQVDDLGNCTVG